MTFKFSKKPQRSPHRSFVSWLSAFIAQSRKVVSLRIKQQLRPKTWTHHSAVQLWTACTVFVCVCIYVGGPVRCSVIHAHICVHVCACVRARVRVYKCVGPHFLLVLQNNRFLSVEHRLFILETALHVQTCLSLPGSVILKHIWLLLELSLWFAPC